jgi:probable HAF family extracellular repeat protein
MRLTNRFILFFLAAALCILAAPRVCAQYYTATDLGTLPGQTYSNAIGINNSGLIIGNTDGVAFRYSGGVMTALVAPLGGNPYVNYSTWATAVNGSGLIVGYAVDENIYGIGSGFINSGGVSSYLNGLGINGFPYSVNDSGMIVGQLFTSQYISSAFSDIGGTIDNLGTLGGTNSAAFGVNNAGLIVGTSLTATGAEHAFSDSGGLMTDLGTLGGGSSAANAVNNAGLIVGSSLTSTGASHAFSYDGGVMTDLGTLGGGGSTSATAVNDSGLIVGDDTTAGGGEGAFIDTAGEMKNLNYLTSSLNTDFVSLISASGINDSGMIVGEGITTSGNYVAVLLTPTASAPTLTLSDYYSPTVPDTSNSALLLTIGMSVTVILGRRRQNRRKQCFLSER